MSSFDDDDAPQVDGLDRETSTYIGVSIAIASTVFIGSSFIIKKLALLRIKENGDLGAGDGGHAYLKHPMWWLGLIFMVLGEIANFVGYMFAPAVLITPLGALSVILSAILSSVVLKEKLTFLGKIGCVVCVLGSTIVILNAPHEKSFSSIEQLMSQALEPGFIVFLSFNLLANLVLIFFAEPRWGHTNVLIYVGICSLCGAVTVMAIKGVGIALRLSIEDPVNKQQMNKWETYVFLGVTVFTIIVQMNYLNKALDTFNTALVSCVYYVVFTFMTIVASTILYKPFDEISEDGGARTGSTLVGFAVICCGVIVLYRTVERSQEEAEGRTLDAHMHGGMHDRERRMYRDDEVDIDEVHVDANMNMNMNVNMNMDEGLQVPTDTSRLLTSGSRSPSSDFSSMGKF